MMIDEYTLKQLRKLFQKAEKNGRIVEITKNGKVFTCDKYDGCDGHRFRSIDEAIEWEDRYL